MTDHAKNLADALRKIANQSPIGPNTAQWMQSTAREALAAYDTRPQEDWYDKIDHIDKDVQPSTPGLHLPELTQDQREYLEKILRAQKYDPTVVIGGPRPQASEDLVERLAFDLFKADWPNKAEVKWLGDGTPDNPGHAKLKDRAFDRYVMLANVALSRAPQPDTVTEEKITIALNAFDTGIGDPNDYRKRMRVALTAALAVKAKPPTDEELAGAGGMK